MMSNIGGKWHLLDCGMDEDDTIRKHVVNARGAHYIVLTPTNALLHILTEIPKIEP